jgi:anthranilate synthase/aminodeoxychorismate synthase-like glutamine amidotransferase
MRAPELLHGKTSMVEHHSTGVFTGIPSPVQATRYHSLIVERATLPACLEVTAETDDGMIMGMRHREFDIEGVQFHPESILTNSGHQMIANFLARL